MCVRVLVCASVSSCLLTIRQGLSWVVSRRYSEFTTLYERLNAASVQEVPELPGKRFFGNMSTECVESRRVGLEKFLQVLCSWGGSVSPATNGLDVFLSFIEATPAELALRRQAQQLRERMTAVLEENRQAIDRMHAATTKERALSEESSKLHDLRDELMGLSLIHI